MSYQYTYGDILNQMKSAKLSLWNNKFSEVFDFTQGPNCNFKISNQMDGSIIAPLHQAKKTDENTLVNVKCQ